MHDWSKLIRERMGSMNLSEATKAEVVTELAAHLQDIYDAEIAEGAGEAHALKFALDQVANCRLLAKNIERAKRKEGIMNNRSKQFWLPALLSLSASMIWLMVIELTAEKLHMPWRYSNIAFMPYVVWIITLPLIGAASGYLSYRAGSTRPARFTAVAFPSMVMFVLWLVLVTYLLARKSPQTIHALSIGYGLLFWVVVPGVALLLGTLPLSKIRTRMMDSIEG
jgi:hypothetical protein